MIAAKLVAVALVCAVSAGHGAPPPQMNPRPYQMAGTHQALHHRGEFFEVYSTTKNLR